MLLTNAMFGLLVTTLLVTGCTRAPSVETSTAAPASSLPDYLVRLAKDGDLYARDADKIVSAPAADIAVLRRYPQWKVTVFR